MADYTFAQLESLWIEAGGPRAVAPIAAAIAKAESNGDPNAVNRNDPIGGGRTQTAWGLWQIANGTHNMPVPNILNPRVNAAQAVAKFQAAGNTFRDWGTYTTGVYTRFLPKGYVAPAAVNAPGGTQAAASGGGGGGGGGSGIFGLIDGIGKTVGSFITGPISVAEAVSSIAHDTGILFGTLNTLATDALWLFKPGNWIRIMAFLFGVAALLPGIWMLSKAGSGEGDISLALGILLVMVAGMLLWVAFHNLPDSVTSISELMAHLSNKVRENSPAVTG